MLGFCINPINKHSARNFSISFAVVVVQTYEQGWQNLWGLLVIYCSTNKFVSLEII